MSHVTPKLITSPLITKLKDTVQLIVFYDFLHKTHLIQLFLYFSVTVEVDDT